MEQGIEEHFLEQWHQKLHTNTTPEDINICEAYLGCLHSGNPDDFWRLLWENGNITREQLASMDRPITGEEPCTHHPQFSKSASKVLCKQSTVSTNPLVRMIHSKAKVSLHSVTQK